MSGEAVLDSEEEDSDFVLGACILVNENLDPKSRPRGCSDSLHRLDSPTLAYLDAPSHVYSAVSCVQQPSVSIVWFLISRLKLGFVGNCEKLKLAEDMLQRRRFVLYARVWWTCYFWARLV